MLTQRIYSIKLLITTRYETSILSAQRLEEKEGSRHTVSIIDPALRISHAHVR